MSYWKSVLCATPSAKRRMWLEITRTRCVSHLCFSSSPRKEHLISSVICSCAPGREWRLTLVIGFIRRPRRHGLEKGHALIVPPAPGRPAEQRREDGLAHISIGPKDLVHPKRAPEQRGKRRLHRASIRRVCYQSASGTSQPTQLSDRGMGEWSLTL